MQRALFCCVFDQIRSGNCKISIKSYENQMLNNSVLIHLKRYTTQKYSYLSGSTIEILLESPKEQQTLLSHQKMGETHLLGLAHTLM